MVQVSINENANGTSMGVEINKKMFVIHYHYKVNELIFSQFAKMIEKY